MRVSAPPTSNTSAAPRVRSRAEVGQVAGDRPVAEHDAEPRRIDRAGIEARVVHGELGRPHRELRGADHEVEAFAVFLFEVIAGVEADDLGAEAYGQGRD